MSIDPYRAWIDYTQTSQKPWLIRPPCSEDIWGGLAGQDMGLGTNQRFPLRPIDKGGIPLYRNWSNGLYYAMTAAHVKDYAGILIAAQFSGLAVMRILKGIITLGNGVIACVAGHNVMCDAVATYGDFGEIIPQYSAGIQTNVADQAYTAGNNLTLTLPAGIWKIKSIDQAMFKAEAAPEEPVTVVVDADDTASPSAGHIAFEPAQGNLIVRFGTSIAEGDELKLWLTGYDDQKYPWTVGQAVKDGTRRTSASVAGSNVEVEMQ